MLMLTITTPDQQEHSGSLQDILSQETYTILYFYPKDNTPGCTRESQDFTRLTIKFASHHIQVIGVSRDAYTSHCSFMEKQQIGVPLISDPDLILHKQFGARGEKNTYGKKSIGVIRSTFFLDQHGTIIKERKNVKATGHAERILKYIEQERQV